MLDERIQEAADADLELGAGRIVELVAILIVHGLGASLGEVFYAGFISAMVAAIRDGRNHSIRHTARHLPYWRLLAVDVLLALFVAIGLLALIVPGLFILGRLALVAPVVEIEDAGVRAALRRSSRLVRGNTLRVLALVAPILVLSDALTTTVQNGSLFELGETFVGDWFAAAAVDIVTAPFFALAVVVCYFELRALPTRAARRPRLRRRAAAS